VAIEGRDATNGPATDAPVRGTVGQPTVASAAAGSFSIVQRKALSPNSFDSLDELADRLLRFGEHYPQIARPFDWTVTRADLERVPAKITEREPRLALAA